MAGLINQVLSGPYYLNAGVFQAVPAAEFVVYFSLVPSRDPKVADFEYHCLNGVWFVGRVVLFHLSLFLVVNLIPFNTTKIYRFIPKVKFLPK